jgi:hypothetical protein
VDKLWLVTAILKQIKVRFGINLKWSRSLEHGMQALVDSNGDGQVMLMGAYHLCRTTEFMRAESLAFTYPGFSPDKDSLSETAKKYGRFKHCNRTK